MPQHSEYLALSVRRVQQVPPCPPSLRGRSPCPLLPYWEEEGAAGTAAAAVEEELELRVVLRFVSVGRADGELYVELNMAWPAWAGSPPSELMHHGGATDRRSWGSSRCEAAAASCSMHTAAAATGPARGEAIKQRTEGGWGNEWVDGWARGVGIGGDDDRRLPAFLPPALTVEVNGGRV